MADEQPRKQAAFLRWMGPILDALRELGGSGTPKQVAEIVATSLTPMLLAQQATLLDSARFPTARSNS